MTRGYRVITIDGKSFAAHRLAWYLATGAPPSADIDHANTNRADNRISNLRLATKKLNMQNRAGANANSSSGMLGVSWDRQTQRWRAAINVEGRFIHLGRFATKEQALEARLVAERLHHPFSTRAA